MFWVILLVLVAAVVYDLIVNKDKRQAEKAEKERRAAAWRELNAKPHRIDYRQNRGEIVYACSVCGGRYIGPFSVCLNCGTELEFALIDESELTKGTLIEHPHYIDSTDYECSVCRKRFEDKSKVCPYCGAVFTDMETDTWC